MIYQRYEKDMWNITWELFLEIRIMEMQWKCLGRIWGVPSLFRNFLGIFLCRENGFLLLCVHCSDVPSNFSLGQGQTHGPVWAGSATGAVRCTGSVLCSGLLFSRTGSCEPRQGKRERGSVADT